MKSVLRFFSVSSLFFSCKRLIFLLLLLSGFASAAWGDYYVAGSFNDWNAKHGDYKMHTNTNEAKLAVVLDAGTHTWKVTNGTWNTSWGSNGGSNNITTTLKVRSLVVFNYNSGKPTATVDYNKDAFNQAAGTIYYDATNTPEVINTTTNTCYLMMGHGSYCARYSMTRVLGTKNLYCIKNFAKWDGATGWYITSQSSGYDSDLYRWAWSGDYTTTATYQSAFTNNYVYPAGPNTTSQFGLNQGSTKRYTWGTKFAYTTPKVTVTTPTNGTISLKDYDDRAVTASASGTEVPYLTILKITAAPNANYELVSVTIGSTTYTAAQFTQGMEYTVTAATTISATFQATTCSTKPTININGTPTSTTNSITVNATATASGANCSLTDTGIKLYSDQACTQEVKSVSVQATSGTALDITATGLTHNTTYYVKAYASTGAGTTYTDAVEVNTLPLYATYEIRGSFDGESWPSVNKCTVLEGSEEACSITKELAANTTYEFKFVLTDSRVTEDWFGNSGTMNSGNCTGWTFDTNNDTNCKITTTIAGEYIFSMQYKGGKYQVSVTYPTPDCDETNPCIVQGNTFYLQPSANWKVDNARFAAYFFNECENKNTWVSMTDNNADGIYECTVPEGNWLNLIFCRMNPASAENNWNDDVKWNQTANLNASCGYDLFVVPENVWNGADDSNWVYQIPEVSGAYIAATRNITTVCSNDLSRFASLYVHQTGEEDAENEGYELESYQWMYSNNGTSWSNYTPDAATEYGVKGKNNNIRTYQTGHYRCDITLSNGTDSKVLQSNVIEVTAAADCNAGITSRGEDFPVFYITTTENFPTCSESYNSVCGEAMKAKRTVDVKMYNKGELCYDRKARMNIRGSSSMNFDKKSYAFVGGKADAKVGGAVKTDELSFFGMPEHKDWVLYAAYADASMLRNALAMKAYGIMSGMWSCRTQHVHVYMDGKYAGAYVFMEKPTYGQGRVVVNKESGYLFGFDKTATVDRFESDDNSIDAKKNTFVSIYSGRSGINSYDTQFDQRFEIEYPEREKVAFNDDEELVNEQAWTDKVNTLKARINEFEVALAEKDYSKVRSVIDYQTWADWFILVEFCKNIDGFRASNWFIIENEGAPIKASPIWDFELSFGNQAPNATIGESTAGWLHENSGMHTDGFPIPFWFNGIGCTNNNTGDKDGTGWIINQDVNFGGLLKDPCFMQMVKDRWAVHTANDGGITQLIEWITTQSNIDNLAALLDAEQARWPAGNRGQMGYDAQSDWASQVASMQTWVQNRKTAMDALIDAWDTGKMNAMIKDATPQDWQTQDYTTSNGVNVYTFDEGTENMVLVAYTTDKNGNDLPQYMQAATMWKFYPSTEELTVEKLDKLSPSRWQLLSSSGNYHLPPLTQDESGYYKVEGPLCGSNLQSPYLRVVVTPTCINDDCDNCYYRIRYNTWATGASFDSEIQKGSADGKLSFVTSIPCDTEIDYIVQYKQGRNNWQEFGMSGGLSGDGVNRCMRIDLTGAYATGPNAAEEDVLLFDCDDDDATLYYHIGFYYDGALIESIPSLVGETGVAKGESISFENVKVPDGAVYIVYSTYNLNTYDAELSCQYHQQYVPYDKTNVGVTATLTVDENNLPSVSFTKTDFGHAYWVSTPFAGRKGFEGSQQNVQITSNDARNNTMFKVDCNGLKAGAKGDYYLYKYMQYDSSNPWVGELANSGIKDGAKSNTEVATINDAYSFNDGMTHNIWVRWLYNEAKEKAYVHYVRDMVLECKDHQGNSTYVDGTDDTANGVVTFNVADLSNIAGYRIAAKPPHNTDSYNQYPYGMEWQTLTTNLGSATFAYNYAQNCMQIIYSDVTMIQIPCQSDGLSITANGKLQVKVENIGTQEVLEGSYKVVVSNRGQLLTMLGTGTSFMGKALNAGDTEVFTSNETIGDEYYLVASLYYGTDFIGSCVLRNSFCQYNVSDTVRYTVDANLGLDYQDPCMLTFGSLEVAISHLKSTPDFVLGTNLKVPVVMSVAYSPTVYEGTTVAGVSGGGTESENAKALIIEDINNNLTEKRQPLIIRAADNNAKPWVHHIIIRNSREVTLDGLFIVSDPTGMVHDNALEFDVNTSKWDMIETGALSNANIMVKNSTIGSSGFTGVHASGYDGINFVNNDFEAVFDGTDDNSRIFGASAKFLRCSNIRFLRNNFRGDHATLVWLQESTHVLMLNNVFWNTNQYYGKCAAIRLISQFGLPVSTISICYNTLFLENSEKNSYKYDFLSFTQQHESIGKYPNSYSGIEFRYNNCYSYDTDIPGRNSDAEAFLGIDIPTKFKSFCTNNFWSEYDELQQNSISVFSFGCEEEMTNVRNLLCNTQATGPASILVKGSALNRGVKPIDDNPQVYTQIESMAQYLKIKGYQPFEIDRIGNLRPDTDDGWTLGAYQEGEDIVTETIIWQGAVSSDWDDRNNWIDKETGRRLNCLNLLSKELTAIIPAEFSTKYPRPAEGITNWPKIPESFTSGRTNMEYGEHVSAGLGTAKYADEITMYVKNITMEYGSGMSGVENLVSNAGKSDEQRHYDEVVYEFDVARSQWVLVGTVVKKADKEAEGGYRNMVSGDYYIANHEPHVYMHEALIDESGKAYWGANFPDLNVEVPSDRVFAIQIPDQYGPNKLKAARYYRKDADESKKLLGTVPWSYYFSGRFVNESAMPTYNDLTVGKSNLINNSYPMNIDAHVIEQKGLGSVLLYDYVKKSFQNIIPNQAAVIKPQHGFVVQPTASTLSITADMLVAGDTKSRSVAAEKPLYVLQLNNANSTGGEASVIQIAFDAAASGVAPALLDSRKLYSYNVSTPDLYMRYYDDAYQRLHIASQSLRIPLGIYLQEPMSVSFQMASNQGFVKMTLVDEQTGKMYNLLNNDKIIIKDLPAGTIEGRFYLNAEVDAEALPGDDVLTDVTEDSDNAAIQLYVENGTTICITATEGSLQEVYVSDITGRTHTYHVQGGHVKLRPPVANGVYTVRVVSSQASRISKVILN